MAVIVVITVVIVVITAVIAVNSRYVLYDSYTDKYKLLSPFSLGDYITFYNISFIYIHYHLFILYLSFNLN